MKRLKMFMAAAVVSAVAFVGGHTATADAYLHAANAGQFCAGWNQPTASSDFSPFGRYWALYVDNNGVGYDTHRISDSRVLLTIVEWSNQAWDGTYNSAVFAPFRCDISGSDSNQVVTTVTAHAIGVYPYSSPDIS